jgi:ABC-type Fe3+/spermidine/putrescine transport system ATPase subunit
MVVAGFQHPTTGSIWAGGIDITGLAPNKRNFGVMFQSYALFPHMSVAANIGYPLRARGIKRQARRKRVEQVLELVALGHLAHRKPAQLSGGQQQRVALARALVYRPSILLLDEPLGALDRAMREELQIELRSLHQQTGTTFLSVTHDQDEALRMSDRVAVMRDGRIEQIGSPTEIYRRPATDFVATFVGKANLLAVDEVGVVDDGLALCRLANGARLRVAAPSHIRAPRADVMLRPEALSTSPIEGDEPGGELEGIVLQAVFAGSTWRCQVRTSAGDVEAHLAQPPESGPGEQVTLHWRQADAWLVARGERTGE